MPNLYGVPEFFVSGVMSVTLLSGDCVRFVYYREHDDGGREPVLSVVRPLTAIPAATDQIVHSLGAKAIGGALGVLS